MKAGNLLFSAVQFILVMLIILLGVFFIGLQHLPHLRYAIADFFSHSARFSFIGYLILACGGLLLVGFYAMHRGIYYRIKMGQNKVFVDPTVIRRIACEYWKTIFPDQNLSIEVALSKDQQIEMFVELPLLAAERQIDILKKAESELGQMLQNHLGYRKEFLISILVK